MPNAERGKVSPEESRAFYGDLSSEDFERKVKVFSQMLQSGSFSDEAEMERWLADQAVGYVQRELIAIMGTGLLTEEFARMAKKAFRMAEQQPLDMEDLEFLNQLESSLPQIESELVVKGQEQRLENLLKSMHEFSRQHGLRPPQESTW